MRRLLQWLRSKPRVWVAPPGLYVFKDGNVQDCGLEWKPVSTLFKRRT